MSTVPPALPPAVPLVATAFPAFPWVKVLKVTVLVLMVNSTAFSVVTAF